MGHGEIIERLRRHYNDVPELTHNPNPEFEKIVEQLEGPETFRKTVANGLTKEHHALDEIRESDLEGAKFGGFDSEFSFVVIKIPEDKIPNLMKKFGLIQPGVIIVGRNFEEDSPFHEINVALLRDEEFINVGVEHEMSHIIFDSRCRPRKEIRSTIDSLNENEEELRKNYHKSRLNMTETYLIDEIVACDAQHRKMPIEEKELYVNYLSKNYTDKYENAYGDSLPNSGSVSLHKAKRIIDKEFVSWWKGIVFGDEVMADFQKLDFARRYALALANDLYENDILPNCGVISMHDARNTLENVARDYFKKRLDAGVDAFKILRNNLPKGRATRIAISCGPEGPIDELVEWSKHYKEVLGVGNGGK